MRPEAVSTGHDRPPSPWSLSVADALRSVGSAREGLSAVEARTRLAATPPTHRHQASWVQVLIKQFTSPFVLVLLVATIISMVVGDVTDGSIVVAIIVASGLLGFAQDYRAGRDVAALLARVQVTATVLRDGKRVEVPVSQVVCGDVVVLSAGSVIPSDCRLLTANALLVDESVLTGESFPVEKDADAVLGESAPIAQRINSVFFGTHVASGDAEAVAFGVGERTELGRINRDLRARQSTTAYERGLSRFGYLLVRLMVLLTGFIFVVNTVLGRPLLESLLFSLALAVGLTPQMLPAIVTLSLSAGARLMAREQVIVKRLEVIEDFGSMSILCTDKTGTLTQGAPKLDLALDLTGAESAEVLRLASLNAGLQAGFANPMDAAILARLTPASGSVALGEIPYDFTRKRLAVLTKVDQSPVLIVKGAVDGVLGCCSHAELNGTLVPISEVRPALRRRFEQLSADGYRVLGLATRPFSGQAARLAPDAERELTLRGLLAFHDPTKDTAAQAVRDLSRLGVSLRLVTGDSLPAAQAAARNVGLFVDDTLTGAQIDLLDDAALAAAVGDVEVFAEVEPHTKRRIVMAFRAAGAGVGFLGDGINDAPALHAADVGISVDTAVDVAKEAAAVVLLQKNLEVVIDGVRLGRRTFANTRKYTRLTTSANFGNMLSMAVASIFLPFLPLLPLQILLLNFLSDIPSLAIAADQVDPEDSERPATWDIAEARRFLLVFGAVSTVFDLATFAVLIWILQVDATGFRSAWFVESTVTELLVLFSLRTSRSMFSSRPARLLLILSGLVGVVVIAIPYLPPLAGLLGLAPLGPAVVFAVAVIAIAYLATNEVVKHSYVRHFSAGHAQ